MVAKACVCSQVLTTTASNSRAWSNSRRKSLSRRAFGNLAAAASMARALTSHRATMFSPLTEPMVAALLLALVGMVFLSQPSTQAGGQPFAPQTAAYFPADNRLLIAVALPTPQEKELAGKLEVELLAAGKVIANQGQAVRRQDPT